MGLFRRFVRFTLVVSRALAGAPVLRCSRVRRRRLCTPSITRRSLRIARQRYRRLTINTDIDSDDSDDSDAPAQDPITTRTMTRKALRESGCKCTHTPFHKVTGFAEVRCGCNLPGADTEAEYFGQHEDDQDHKYS